MNKVASINREGISAQGRTELLRHLEGKVITLRQAVKGKCYECMGYYADGKRDCQIPDCPLYPWMPFKAGGVRKSKTLSDEQKARLASTRTHRRPSSNITGGGV